MPLMRILGTAKTAKKSPTKRGRPAKSSPSKKTVSKTTKDSITIGPGEEVKASHPAIVMELVEIALDRVTPEDRARVATKYGLKPNLVHMVGPDEWVMLSAMLIPLPNRTGRTSRSKSTGDTAISSMQAEVVLFHRRKIARVVKDAIS